MQLNFYKYQGAGNDFIILDNTDGRYTLTKSQIESLCDRRFGIGADGLMYVNKSEEYDFEMVYFNADGNESTMCGNGGRCIVQFAFDQQIINKKDVVFNAIDGVHAAVVNKNSVALGMIDVLDIQQFEDGYFLFTGSPHFVKWVNELDHYDVYHEGKRLRYDERFSPGGTNVNFIQMNDGIVSIRTYERGVEDETLACGTGVVAASIIANIDNNGDIAVAVKAKGGDLTVTCHKEQHTVSNIILEGPANKVFAGTIEI